jgi:hypothetical protein
MRTLVTAVLHSPAEEALASWLQALGYEPSDVHQKALLSEADVLALVSGAMVPDSQPAVSGPVRAAPHEPPPLVVALSQAIALDPVLAGTAGGDLLDSVFSRSRVLRLLESIPSSPDRVQAILTRRYLIHYARPSSGADVWGLVCLEGLRVRVRWRHGTAADLEDATKRFLEECKRECRPDGLFSAVHDEVPVKEDGALEPAYTGRYLSDDAKLQRARREKKLELLLSRFSLLVVVICAVAGLALYPFNGNERVQWLIGWIERFGTGSIVTLAQSYLSYRIHLEDLRSKPVMDWR